MLPPCGHSLTLHPSQIKGSYPEIWKLPLLQKHRKDSHPRPPPTPGSPEPCHFSRDGPQRNHPAREWYKHKRQDITYLLQSLTRAVGPRRMLSLTGPQLPVYKTRTSGWVSQAWKALCSPQSCKEDLRETLRIRVTAPERDSLSLPPPVPTRA